MEKEIKKLRNEAAIAAMSALLPTYEAPLPGELEKKGISSETYLAKKCVKYANALAKELENEEEY